MLWAASREGHLGCMRMLLRHGASADGGPSTAPASHPAAVASQLRTYPPLHVAANAEAARLLLEAGASVNALRSGHEQSALYNAAQAYSDRSDVVRVLLEAGAKPLKCVAVSNGSCLHLAVAVAVCLLSVWARGIRTFCRSACTV